MADAPKPLSSPLDLIDFELGVPQVLDWARAWVWNETCIPESAEADLTPSEREGLKLLRFMLGADHGL